MADVCPHCGAALTTDPDPLATLRRWLVDRGHWVGSGDETDTAGAAAVLGVSAGWLRVQRCYFADDAPPFRREGRRCLYRLRDLLRS